MWSQYPDKLIRSFVDRNKCLNLTYTTINNPLTTFSCIPSDPFQKFGIPPANTEGRIRLTGFDNNKCLVLDSGSGFQNGSVIRVQFCNGNSEQIWIPRSSNY
jgi:hypothetical protein